MARDRQELLAFGSSATAKLPSRPPGRRFPLIDEPTNHLDADGRRQLADYLRSKPGFLLISHDRAFLDACCDHVVALNRDTVEVERTSFSAWRERFRQRLARQRSENAPLKEEIGRHTQVAADRRAGALKRESDRALNRARRQMKKALVAERRAGNAADERRRTLVDVEKERHLRLPDTGRVAGSLVVANNLSLWARRRAGVRQAVVHDCAGATESPSSDPTAAASRACWTRSKAHRIDTRAHSQGRRM